MKPASIVFDEVKVRYPGAERNAVDGVSFEIAGGELVVLLGPSGCGKSTLLRTVNRLVPLDGGRVIVDGRSVAELDPVALRRGIGYVIQAIGLFAHLDVAQNIAVVPSLQGWNRTKIANVCGCGPIEKLQWRPELLDPSLAHDDDPVGEPKGFVDIVGYEERRSRQVAHDTNQLALQRGARYDVNGAKRLVH